jgi:hypothetical protein
LEGPSRQRFASDACRKRAARRRASGNGQNPDTIADALPVGEPGRARAGLEAWIAEKQGWDLPSSVVEAARLLADQVDGDPDHSPLWGRYLDCLRQLHEPEQQAVAWNHEVERLYQELLIVRADEEWRSSKWREAVERGEDPSGWERVVPIGCARGKHKWRKRADSPPYCVHCDPTGESDFGPGYTPEMSEP